MFLNFWYFMTLQQIRDNKNIYTLKIDVYTLISTTLVIVDRTRELLQRVGVLYTSYMYK